MKKLMNSVSVAMMILFVCSCGNNVGQQSESKEQKETEKFFSYKVLSRKNSIHKEDSGIYTLAGLAILIGDDNSSNYMLFDDEEDYYNEYIYEWALALGIASHQYTFAYADDPIWKKENNLICVHCLPDCLDKYGIVNDKERELILKTYYDLKDAAIYEPSRGYGYRKYPVEMAKYRNKYVVLYRIGDGEFDDVPTGTLGIKFSNVEYGGL